MGQYVTVVSGVTRWQFNVFSSIFPLLSRVWDSHTMLKKELDQHILKTPKGLPFIFVCVSLALLNVWCPALHVDLSQAAIQAKQYYFMEKLRLTVTKWWCGDFQPTITIWIIYAWYNHLLACINQHVTRTPVSECYMLISPQ